MKRSKKLTKLSKFLSYILRHHPEAIGLELDRHGWAHIPTLIKKAQDHGKTLSRELLRKVVHSGDKQRFIISGEKEHIRAGYGHSIPVDLSLESKKPPEILFHGTARQNVAGILKEGLHAGSRNFVHLSAEKEDAISVGARHGKPVVLQIKAFKMHKAGLPFYQSESEPGIWLVQEVPAGFISQSSTPK